MKFYWNGCLFILDWSIEINGEGSSVTNRGKAAASMPELYSARVACSEKRETLYEPKGENYYVNDP